MGAQVDPASDDHVEVRSSTPAPSSPDDRTKQGGKRSVQPASQPEQPESNVSSGVKCDARAALPDEDEQGGKFQQAEGLTTVDAEEIPCEFSVEDDFEVDETAEGVDDDIVKASLAGKKKELDAMDAFGIFDVYEELRKDAKIIPTRWRKRSKRRQVRMQVRSQRAQTRRSGNGRAPHLRQHGSNR